MYELIILSLLMRWPAHGYLIAKIINDMIGPYARISNGRLYPLLAKMEQDGLIVANNEPVKTQRSERQSRSYRITEEGRKRFHQLMMDTTSNPGDYSRIFFQKVSVLEFLKPAERLYLIDHYINYCQAHILHLQAETAELEREAPQWWGPSELRATLRVMEHAIDQWQLELDWARSLRALEEASAKAIEFEVEK